MHRTPWILVALTIACATTPPPQFAAPAPEPRASLPVEEAVFEVPLADALEAGEVLAPPDPRRPAAQTVAHFEPEAALPALAEAPAAETGGLDAAIVANVLAQNRAAMSACYDRALKRGELRGRLELTLTIEPSGDVSESRVDGAEDELGSCLARTVQRWRFPPFGGDALQFSVPLLLDFS